MPSCAEFTYFWAKSKTTGPALTSIPDCLIPQPPERQVKSIITCAAVKIKKNEVFIMAKTWTFWDVANEVENLQCRLELCYAPLQLVIDELNDLQQNPDYQGMAVYTNALTLSLSNLLDLRNDMQPVIDGATRQYKGSGVKAQ